MTQSDSFCVIADYPSAHLFDCLCAFSIFPAIQFQDPLPILCTREMRKRPGCCALAQEKQTGIVHQRKICHRRSQFVFISNYYASTALKRATSLPPCLTLDKQWYFLWGSLYWVQLPTLAVVSSLWAQQLLWITAKKKLNKLSLHAACVHRRNASALMCVFVCAFPFKRLSIVCWGDSQVVQLCCPRRFHAINTGSCAHGRGRGRPHPSCFLTTTTAAEGGRWKDREEASDGTVTLSGQLGELPCFLCWLLTW